MCGSSYKPDPYIPQFSEKSQEHWARMDEQVMCGSVYSYILAIRHYAPNTFSALPNLPNRRIHILKISSRHYSSIYTRTPENINEYSVFAYSPRINVCAYLALQTYRTPFGHAVCNLSSWKISLSCKNHFLR